MLSKNEPSSLFSEEIINQMIIDSSWTNLKIEIPTSWIKKFIIDYDINKGAWDRFIFYLHRIEPKIITDLRAFEAQLANNFLSIDETMQLFSMLLYEVQEGSCAYREIDYLKHKIANQYIGREYYICDQNDYFFKCLELLIQSNLFNKTNFLRVYLFHINNYSILWETKYPEKNDIVNSLINEGYFNQKTFDFICLIKQSYGLLKYTKKLYLAGILDNTETMVDLFNEKNCTYETIKHLNANNLLRAPYLRLFINAKKNNPYLDLKSTISKFKNLRLIEKSDVYSSIMTVLEDNLHSPLFSQLIRDLYTFSQPGRYIVNSLINEGYFNQKTFDFICLIEQRYTLNWLLKYTKKLYLAGILDNTEIMADLFNEKHSTYETIKHLNANNLLSAPYIRLFINAEKNNLHLDLHSIMRKFKNLTLIENTLVYSSIMTVLENNLHSTFLFSKLIHGLYALNQVGLCNEKTIAQYVQEPTKINFADLKIKEHLQLDQARVYNHYKVINLLPDVLWLYIFRFFDQKMPPQLASSCQVFNQLDITNFTVDYYYQILLSCAISSTLASNQKDIEDKPEENTIESTSMVIL